MRIIGGRFKRRRIGTPAGHLTRPTTSRARESAFNLIQARVPIAAASVLDLFAGSGALGLEALSRGASHATFVEADGRVIAVARSNAKELGVEESSTFLRADALVYLTREPDQRYDLIFADPPYHLPSVALLPDLAIPHLNEGGLFVLEHDTRISLAHHPNLETSRSYGKAVVSIFHAADDERSDETHDPDNT